MPSRLAIAVLTCVAALLGIAVTSASAAPTAGSGWAYANTFGSPIPIFETPHSPIAIGGDGNIFAVNQNQGTVRIYSPNAGTGGILLTEIPYLGPGPRNLAIDPSDESVYMDGVGAFGFTSINRVISNGAAVPAYSLDPSFELPEGAGLAVDPTTGDLLVAKPTAEAVLRYSKSGTLLATIATPSVAPAWIVTAPDGSFYVAPESGGEVTHFSGAGAELSTISGVGALQGLTFDSIRGVLVASSGSRLLTFTPAGQLESDVPAATASGDGIAFNAVDGRLYQEASGTYYAYVPATVPGVEPPTVSGIGAHKAHFEAEVDPGAGPPSGSAVHFEYSADNGKTWISTPNQSLSAPGSVLVETEASGLLPNLEYQVRTVARNEGYSQVSEVVSFRTQEIAPEVTTGAATDVGETTGVMNGTINPAGYQTTFHFEWGTSTAYGSRVPAGIEAVAGNGRENRAFSRTLSGLEHGVTYHFRLVAESALGRTVGADQAFTTTLPGAFPSRHYEQVTPTDKHGVSIEPAEGFYAFDDASAVAYITKGSEAGAPLHSRSLAIRGTDDWRSLDLDPPLNPGDVWNSVFAVSDDQSHSFVVSNRKLSPGANENGVNLYREDNESHTFQLVASTPEPVFKAATYLGNGGFYWGASPDMSSIVFTFRWPVIDGVNIYGGVYRWSEAGGLELVSKLPNGEPSYAAAIGEEPDWNPVSADGSRIYFTGTFPEPGMYLWEDGHTRAVSVSEVVGEPIGVRSAAFMGASKDGRYAFLAMTESGVKLTPDAPGQTGDLYRYDASGGSLEYLGAGVSASGAGINYSLGVSPDGQIIWFRTDAGVKVWRDGVVTSVSAVTHGSREAMPSPNGRYLVFMGERGVERFDAVTDELACVSCLPDGTPSETEAADGQYYSPLHGNGESLFLGTRFARAVTNAGQVFYTTPARLVAADVNGKTDVYEYRDGANHLISPGNGPFNAYLGEVSEDGKDVYFTTAQKLVGRDNDEKVDIYDARIGGELPIQNPPPPQECLRDDCKATPNAGPELPFGGSEALSGPGNLTVGAKRCPKGQKLHKVKGKKRCVNTRKPKKKKAKQSKARPSKSDRGNRR